MNLPESELKTEWLHHEYTQQVLKPQAANDLRCAFFVLMQAAAQSEDNKVGQARLQFLTALELCETFGVDVAGLKALMPKEEKDA